MSQVEAGQVVRFKSDEHRQKYILKGRQDDLTYFPARQGHCESATPESLVLVMGKALVTIAVDEFDDYLMVVPVAPLVSQTDLTPIVRGALHDLKAQKIYLATQQLTWIINHARAGESVEHILQWFVSYWGSGDE